MRAPGKRRGALGRAVAWLLETSADISRAERECRRAAFNEKHTMQRKFREQVEALDRSVGQLPAEGERHGRLGTHPR